jgi:hypothetical protein
MKEGIIRAGQWKENGIFGGRRCEGGEEGN